MVFGWLSSLACATIEFDWFTYYPRFIIDRLFSIILLVFPICGTAEELKTKMHKTYLVRVTERTSDDDDDDEIEVANYVRLVCSLLFFLCVIIVVTR